MPAGQPTKYKKRYCKILMNIMSSGGSVVKFCAEIKISRDTFYEWAKQHKEFSDTWKTAAAICESYWEDIGKRAIFGFPVKDKDGNEGRINERMYAFYMKNRHHWTDRVEQTVQGGIQLKTLTDAEAQALET